MLVAAADVAGVLGLVAADALRALGGRLRLGARPRRGAPVFVMLPLDACRPSCPVDVTRALPRLAAAGVAGIMVDVWWGVTEPRPREYDFSYYRRLAEACKENRLLMQATMSWHACGGNVGDSVTVRLPDWVLAAGDEHDLWYVDREGFVNKECLSLAADNLRVLPTRAPTPAEKPDRPGDPAPDSPADTAAPKGGSVGTVGGQATSATGKGATASRKADRDPMRTPLEAYTDFVKAFVDAMGPDLVGSTVVELQVGCGPCGELRYPSYPLGPGKWAFPGMGEFQCFDRHMLADLAAKAVASGLPPEYSVPPEDTGKYNDSPRNAPFYRGPHKSAQGVYFLEWYANALLDHGRNMLTAVSNALPPRSGLTLAVKISGIHWWRFTSTRPAEAAAGYYVSRTYNFYKRMAALMAEHNAVLDFTCLEMRTIDQPFLSARCGPRQLVREVFADGVDAGARIAGENALQRYDWRAYRQILRAYRGVPAGYAYGFTYLRLGLTLLQEEQFRVFKKFVAEMNGESK